MKLIGLTGGISTGKSTVSNYIRENTDFIIMDADIIAKEINQRQETINAIVGKFGVDILESEDKINTKKLGAIVFNDSEKLKKLNEITHKLIIAELKSMVDKLSMSDSTVVIDAPLLFEAGIDKLFEFDYIWVVTIPLELQIERFVKRNQVSEEYALAVIEKQMSSEEKVSKADVILTNIELEKLYKQIKCAIKKIR